jgi:uncharacterized protein YbjT (DUF2867 family)
MGCTSLRPNLFFQGLFAFAGTIASDNRFYAPIGDARVSAVDVRDIAGVAAAALTEPGHEGTTYTITAPAAITHSEIADALSVATGRQIAFVDVPPDAFRNSLQGMLPDWQLDGLLEDCVTVRSRPSDVRARNSTSRRAREVCETCMPSACSTGLLLSQANRGAQRQGHRTTPRDLPPDA